MPTFLAPAALARFGTEPASALAAFPMLARKSRTPAIERGAA